MYSERVEKIEGGIERPRRPRPKPRKTARGTGHSFAEARSEAAKIR